MDVLGAPLSSFRPWKKLENQEIAFFDTYSEFPQTLIQKLFECFTFCCCSEYQIYTLSLETLTPDQVKNDITYNLSLIETKQKYFCLPFFNLHFLHLQNIFFLHENGAKLTLSVVCLTRIQISFSDSPVSTLTQCIVWVHNPCQPTPRIEPRKTRQACSSQICQSQPK